MNMPVVWENKWMYAWKQKRALKKYEAEKRKILDEKREKLDMAERQADAQGVTIEELIPADQLTALRRPVGEAGHPRFNLAKPVESWNDEWTQVLDRKDGAEWESRQADRLSRVVMWHNIKTGESRRVKPRCLVTKSDKIWRASIGNATEMFRQRTILSYERKIYDHSTLRSPWGGKGKPDSLTVKKGLGGEEEIDEDDPAWVGPWLEEIEGEQVVFRRRNKKGDIIHENAEKPSELMTNEEVQAKKEEEAAQKGREKEAKDKKMRLEVAKAARERKKQRAKKKRK